LVCSNCHALVHAARLEQLAASARLHEAHRVLAAPGYVISLAPLPPSGS
jgi:hypothetical protein